MAAELLQIVGKVNLRLQSVQRGIDRARRRRVRPFSSMDLRLALRELSILRRERRWLQGLKAFIERAQH